MARHWPVCFLSSQVWSELRVRITSWSRCIHIRHFWRTSQHHLTTIPISYTRDPHQHRPTEAETGGQLSKRWSAEEIQQSRICGEPHRRIQRTTSVRRTVMTTHGRDSTSVEDGRNVCKDILFPTAPSESLTLSCFPLHGAGLPETVIRRTGVYFRQCPFVKRSQLFKGQFEHVFMMLSHLYCVWSGINYLHLL